MVADPNNVRELSIYLVDSSDISSISELAKNMAVSFPQINHLNLCLERRCEIVSFLIVIEYYNRTLSNWYMYYFSHFRRLKKISLVSPNCVAQALMAGESWWKIGNAEPNIPGRVRWLTRI